MILKHAKCRGDLILEISSLYLIKAPSISITKSGIGVELVEITAKGSGNSDVKCICRKCGENLSIKDTKEILCLCSLCGNYLPIEELSGSNDFSIICNKCKSYLQEPDISKLPDFIKRLKMFIKSDRKLETYSISELLQKKIIV